MPRGGTLATLLAALFALPACHKMFHHGPHDATPPDVRAAYDEADSSRVYAECGPTVPPTAACGTVVEEVRRERPRFIREICHETPGQHLSDECERRWQAMGLARLEERYYLADPEIIERTCTGHPLECNSPESFEHVWFTVHNAIVDQIRDQKIKKAVAEDDARKKREAEERRKAFAAAWAEAWESHEQHCSSTVIGNRIDTNCY